MTKHAAKLKDEHRAFLVRELACWSTPKESADALSEAYGITITPQSAERYDPTKVAGRRLSKKWRTKFEACRKAFKEQIEEIPIANRAVRLKKLAKAARAFEDSRNYIAMADILERAAKEVGNVHTNKREFTGRDGGPVQLEDVSAMTPEQVQDELAAYMRDPAVAAFVIGLGATSTEAPAIPPTPSKETKHG